MGQAWEGLRVTGAGGQNWDRSGLSAGIRYVLYSQAHSGQSRPHSPTPHLCATKFVTLSVYLLV